MRACLESLKREGAEYWVAMVHSSEIVPCSKLPTQDAVDAFWKRCADLVDDAFALGATPATLEDAWRQCESRIAPPVLR